MDLAMKMYVRNKKAVCVYARTYVFWNVIFHIRYLLNIIRISYKNSWKLCSSY